MQMRVASLVFSHFYDDYVVLPSTELEWKRELTGSIEQWGFPCVGAWDGCRIPISTHGGDTRTYHSFKGFHSIGIMAPVSHDRRFMYAAVGAPGSAHDARVFRRINLYQHICNGEIVPIKIFFLAVNQFHFAS